jgi:hypothetical protein
MSQSNRKLLQYFKEARGNEAATACLTASPLCDISLTHTASQSARPL